ncbi:MAG: hypothetical protein MUE44_36365, partial [Oscillatoriaceae cyanobacterium Prado104]|nr:hypothetical protein [Oscillatoriaceae cyanobacterium Prado104]
VRDENQSQFFSVDFLSPIGDIFSVADSKAQQSEMKIRVNFSLWTFCLQLVTFFRLRARKLSSPG